MSEPTPMTQHKWRQRRPSVAVAMPMTWALHRSAAVDFMHLCKGLRHDDNLMLRHDTAIVDEARNIIVREFLHNPAYAANQHLIMVDDDMRVPVGMVEALTLPNLPIVAGLCTLKTYPYTPTAYVMQERPVATLLPGQEFYGEVPLNLRVITNLEARSGIVKVDATGAACICIRRDVLEAIEPPWFLTEGMGEDIYFCRKARDAGFDIHINTHVPVGHVGVHTATFNDWLANRDRYIQTEGKEIVYADDLPESA